eukprot:PITA_36314
MLRYRMKQEMPDMIFIQETKCSIQKIKQIHSKWLNRFEFLEVKAEITVGGILTHWNPQKINIIDAEASRNYLSVVIQPIGVSETFLVTNVYDPQKIDDKLKLIDSLIDLRNRQTDKHHQEWENLCKQEEIFWRQKSRVQWLKEGEQNTIFFHKSTIANKAQNNISSIKNENGELQNTHKNIEFVLVKHFRNITRENNSNREQSIKEIIRHIPKFVSREDNFNLNRLVTEEEVSEVLKDMQNCKAPGPDGFNVDFFKACWHIVKQDILNVVEDSRCSKTMLKALNTSFISLIPK